jgi:transposase
VPVVDGEPGVECQIDFARMDMLFDAATSRRRVVHALIFTAVYSRHMFVWLTFSQTLTAVIDGCETAWAFFSGVFQPRLTKMFDRASFVTVATAQESSAPDDRGGVPGKSR